MKIMSTYNMAVGSAVAFLSCLLGQYWYLFMAFLLLNIIDEITGLIKSKIYNKISSVEGAKGAFRKVGYWIAIAVAFLIPETLCSMLNDALGINAEFLLLFGWFTLATFMVNEARSVIENLVQIGVEVPEFLIKGLEITEKLIEDSVNDKIPKKDVKVEKEVIK